MTLVRLVLAGILAAVAAVVTVGAADGVVVAQESPGGDRATRAPEPRKGHPLYDDKGALDWRERWDDAAQLAKAQNKLVFVEMGRES